VPAQNIQRLLPETLGGLELSNADLLAFIPQNSINKTNKREKEMAMTASGGAPP